MNLSTRGVVASVAVATHLALLPFNAHAAEKMVVPKFKNVDEAIGWVKAKGNCEKIGKDQQGSRCKIRLDLPDEKLPEAKGESVWERWAWLEVFDLESHRTFTVRIVRSKNFLLSANDSKATVRSVRVSNYWLDRFGKVFEARVDAVIENFIKIKIKGSSLKLINFTPSR